MALRMPVASPATPLSCACRRVASALRVLASDRMRSTSFRPSVTNAGGLKPAASRMSVSLMQPKMRGRSESKLGVPPKTSPGLKFSATFSTSPMAPRERDRPLMLRFGVRKPPALSEAFEKSAKTGGSRSFKKLSRRLPLKPFVL